MSRSSKPAHHGSMASSQSQSDDSALGMSLLYGIAQKAHPSRRRGGSNDKLVVNSTVKSITAKLRADHSDPKCELDAHRVLFEILPTFVNKQSEINAVVESSAFKSLLDEITSAHQEGTPDQTHPEEDASSKNNSVGPSVKVGGQASVDGVTTNTGSHVPKSSGASAGYRRKKKKTDNLTINHPNGINEFDHDYERVREDVLRTLTFAFATYVRPKLAQSMAEKALPEVLENYNWTKSSRGGAIHLNENVYIHPKSTRSEYSWATCSVSYGGNLLAGFKCLPNPNSSDGHLSLQTIMDRSDVAKSKQVIITCPVLNCDHQFVAKAESVAHAIESGMVLDPVAANKSFFNSDKLTEFNISNGGRGMLIPASSFQFLQKRVHEHYSLHHPDQCASCKMYEREAYVIAKKESKGK